MLLKKVTLNEEIDRMKVLAGVSMEQPVLEEGIISKVAAIIGIAASSLSGVFAQTGNIDKLNYSPDKKAAMEQAMADTNVIKKLHELGVDDNNIQRAIDYSKGKEITGYQEKTAGSEREVKTLVKAGWHLTSVESDTVIKITQAEHPNIIRDTIYFNLDEDAMFASGKFVLGENDKANITHILDSIQNSESTLLNVTILSSTDKQGLTTTLKNTLSFLGYSPNNEGLSNARSNGVSTALVSFGIDASLINKEILFEQGGPTIDQDARYVKVAFDVVKLPPPAFPEKGVDTTKTINTAYELFKPTFKYGTINIGKYKPNVCRAKIQTYTKKASALKCMFQQKQVKKISDFVKIKDSQGKTH